MTQQENLTSPTKNPDTRRLSPARFSSFDPSWRPPVYHCVECSNWGRPRGGKVLCSLCAPRIPHTRSTFAGRPVGGVGEGNASERAERQATEMEQRAEREGRPA